MEKMSGVHMIRAEREDLPLILGLQYLAYQEQAVIHNDFSIRPLTQTLDEITDEFNNGVFLKAVNDDGVIIGSVRARSENGTLHIGRLMVRPAMQGLGIGTELLAEIEAMCPHDRCELFTGVKSEDNIRMYERLGYVRFKEEEIRPGIMIVHMRK
jgi:ribosomal protein S18 acetylase RimI-like enzyme